MKITIDVSEKDLKDIFKFSKERKKGPAISKFFNSALMLRRREEFYRSTHFPCSRISSTSRSTASA